MRLVQERDLTLVRFERGEALPEQLNALAAQHDWTCGWVSGIGAVQGVRLAYYDLTRREYLPIDVSGIVELTNLTGNLSRLNGKPFWHLHATVAGRDGDVRGGHVLQMETAITVECWIGLAQIDVVRRPDDFSGLNLLDL